MQQDALWSALTNSRAMQDQIRAALRTLPVAYPGINLAGGEFGDIGRPMGQGYIYPDDWCFAYWAGKGMKLVRLPFKWERVQPAVKGDLASADMAQIDRCVAAAKAAGLTIILDCHNYAERVADGKKSVIGPDVTELGNLWWRLADRYRSQDHVGYGLMNEPAYKSSAQWMPYVREAVRAIRVTEAKGLIMAPSSGWSGAHDFIGRGDAAAYEGFTDSNFMLEVHQYLDGDNSGTHLQEYVAGKGTKVLAPITEWARAKGFRLFLGEFGFAMSAGEAEALAMLRFMAANSDVWGGWACWAAGPWWGDYPFSVEPQNGKDAPHVAVLQKGMTGSA